MAKTFSRSGFSLIEILVVVAVILLLLAIMTPSLGRARERARATVCLSNLRQIGTGILTYASSNDDFAVPRFLQARQPRNIDPLVDGWEGPAGYPNNQGAYWSDPVLLGQYVGSGHAWVYVQEYTSGGVAYRSALHCPSDLQHASGKLATGLSYGMAPNFGSVSFDINPGPPATPKKNPWRKMWRITSCERPLTEMVVVDGFDFRFNPGGGTNPPYPGSTEPLQPNAAPWNADGVGSYYNWSRRHSNGANVLFLDGHATFVQELKAAADAKEITCKMVD